MKRESTVTRKFSFRKKRPNDVKNFTITPNFAMAEVKTDEN